MQKIKEAVEHYWNARILLTKSFQKLNYRLSEKDLERFKIKKKTIYKHLRKMDNLLSEVLQ